MFGLQSEKPATKGLGASFLAPLQAVWHHRILILRLARREISGRYRGSVLGIIWAIINPLLMLAVYTFVFTVVFQSRWGVANAGSGEFALLLFSGLLLFSILAECLNRAPGLLLENVSYIKKVVFPLEILPIVTLLVALFNAAIGFAVLLVFYVAALGLPPATALLLPLPLLPLCLMTLGVSWFLASAGVFLRDIRQIVGAGVTVLMFLSPIFYPVSAVPERFRGFIHLNPLTPILEQSKDLLFWGQAPSFLGWAAITLVAWGCFWLGYLWFMKTRKGFADVV